MNAPSFKSIKIQAIVPSMWVLIAFLAACGNQETVHQTTRVRKPNTAQNSGSQSGANHSADPTQPETVDTEIKRFAFDPAQLKNPGRKMTGLDFDYSYGIANIHPTAPKIRVKVTNAELTSLKSNLGVVITGYPLNDSSSFVTSSTVANIDSNGVLTIRGEKLLPATPYKLRLHFFDLSPFNQTQNTQSTPRYLGTSSQAYQMVTDGISNPLASARSRIAMRGFGEAYDWSLGRYNRQKGYTQDPGGGWCHIFYNWVISQDLKTRVGSQNTHYDPNYWSRMSAKISGSDLVALSQKEAIHGDYFRVSSHAAMIIAYDKSQGEFITLEGNFNNSVQMYRRRANEMSWVGHITQDMLR